MNIQLTHATIRRFQRGDETSAQRSINNLKIARNMLLIPHPYTLDDAREWVGRCTADAEGTHFAIADASGVIGGIGFMRAAAGFADVQRHVAEIGYWLAEPHWGRGITTEAVRALTSWGIEYLGLRRISAAVFSTNTASARVLEKAGYQLEGRERARYFRDGLYVDGLRYAHVAASVPASFQNTPVAQ